MSKKLIINADGFGFTKGINKGIIESIEKGIVSSISCNVNFPHINEVEYIVKHFPRISIGVHLNINVGKPVCSPDKIPSLVNTSGEFWGKAFTKKLFYRKISFAELNMECEAQILKLQSFGVNITHIDGHQNKHLYPGYFGAVLKLGLKHDIKRIRCHNRYLFLKSNINRRNRIFRYYLAHPRQILTHNYARVLMKIASWKGFKIADRLITPAYLDNSEKYLLDSWISIIGLLPSGVNEIYCHPGYPDDELRQYAYYVDERLLEIKVLTSPDLLHCIQKEKVEIISFNHL